MQKFFAIFLLIQYKDFTKWKTIFGVLEAVIWNSFCHSGGGGLPY